MSDFHTWNAQREEIDDLHDQGELPDADLIRSLTLDQVRAIRIGLEDAGHMIAADDFEQYWMACREEDPS